MGCLTTLPLVLYTSSLEQKSEIYNNPATVTHDLLQHLWEIQSDFEV